MKIQTLPRSPSIRPRRASGPVLTPTQRPGLLAALERLVQRTSRNLAGALL